MPRSNHYHNLPCQPPTIPTHQNLDFRYISKYNINIIKKIETIWHDILYSALQNKKYKHTQQKYAKEFNYSLSTVNHALEIPTQIGAIRKESKFFVLSDFFKLLYYWASYRTLTNDIIYKTNSKNTVTKIEGLIVPNSIFAGYTAAKKHLIEPPADYAKVYFYANKNMLTQIKRGFPEEKSDNPNVFVLKEIPSMHKYGNLTTLPQTFVDIWNMPDWYSRNFTGALEKKMAKY